MEWINSNAGLLVLSNIFLGVLFFYLSRWQNREQSEDLRSLALALFEGKTETELIVKAYQQTAKGKSREQRLPLLGEAGEKFQRIRERNLTHVKGSKHQWLKKFFKDCSNKYKREI